MLSCFLCSVTGEVGSGLTSMIILCADFGGIPLVFTCSFIVPTDSELRDFFWLWWVEWLPLPFAVASFHILNYNFSNLFQMSIYFYLLISLHFLFFTIIGCLFSFFVILCFNKVNALPLSAILNWRLDIYWK